MNHKGIFDGKKLVKVSHRADQGGHQQGRSVPARWILTQPGETVGLRHGARPGFYFANKANWPGSRIGTNVWSGRASQEGDRQDGIRGLALMYPASDWSGLVLRAIMDMRAQRI